MNDQTNDDFIKANLPVQPDASASGAGVDEDFFHLESILTHGKPVEIVRLNMATLNHIKTHIAALTAERDALRAEVVRLNRVGAAKTSTIAALCDTADEIERQARIKAEIARLRSQDGEGAE